MALEVKIRKKFGSFILDAEFTAETGVFALLGASGCGKSMTLKCIAGVEHPDEGRIVLDGRVLFDSSEKINLPPQKRHVGYMFQDYALFPNMTVLKNVMAGMGKHPDPSRAEAYLRQFRIADLKDHLPGQLSGGQKQRVAMARIVAQEPEAVLLDEPFSALDSHLKWQLEGEMKSVLSGMSCPAIFVSHSRDEVFHLAQTVCCMDRGKTEQPLKMRDFFKNPGSRTAAVLSGCKNISGAVIRDEYHVEASDWGITFSFPHPVPEDTEYVGVRAHYIYAEPKSHIDTVFEPESFTVTEDPFEWTVFLRAAAGAQPVQWKTPKTPGLQPEIPERFYIRPEDVMLLRK